MTHIYHIDDKAALPQGCHMYLTVADETEEFDNALRYASRVAKASGAYVAVLYVMAEQGFLFWGKVEERVQAEQRQEAEKFLSDVAVRFSAVDGLTPVLFIGEGERTDAIMRVIKANPEIAELILGGNTKARTPGPLVSYFSGRGMGSLPVPLTIVPDHIPPEKIDGFV